MVYDKIEKMSKSTIQHGPNNDRVYLMKLDPEDREKIVDQLYNLAILKRYSKIFAKVPESIVRVFKRNHYKCEAKIPHFYDGKEPGCFMGLYFNSKRSYVSRADRKLMRDIIDSSEEQFDGSGLKLPSEYHIRLIRKEETSQLASLYKQVFKVYPFPIFKPSYLADTMDENIKYFGVFKDNELVAASSSEIDFDNKNAEMTDFATAPAFLGQKLSYFLLQEMETEMSSIGIKTLYTIARAVSHGMNKTFGRLNYHFGGTLTNNTLIGESIESMNVWYKNLL